MKFSILKIISFAIFPLLLFSCATTKQTAVPVNQSENKVEKRSEMVLVKGGCFEMGDTFGEGSKDEKPVHTVCLKSFLISNYLVTQNEWESVMGKNPSYFKGCGECPVDSVFWDDVQAFIKRMNVLTGKKYRLPTEAEWEYAARSGGKMEKWAGTSNESELGDYAWFEKNAGNKTHPVGERKPNGLGLYDMSGNVWEWVNDWYDKHYYKKSPKDNPQGPNKKSYRILRGGSWTNQPASLHASHRGGLTEFNKSFDRGFRLAASTSGK